MDYIFLEESLSDTMKDVLGYICGTVYSRDYGVNCLYLGEIGIWAQIVYHNLAILKHVSSVSKHQNTVQFPILFHGMTLPARP